VWGCLCWRPYLQSCYTLYVTINFKIACSKFSFLQSLFVNLNRNTSSPSSAGYITGCLLENSGYLQILLIRETGRDAIC
jgi:hypothetical protein